MDLPILIHMRRRPLRTPKLLPFPLRIHTSIPAINLFHLESLLSLRLLLRNSHLLKEDISAIIDGASIAVIRALFAAEGRELGGLYLARCALV